MKIASIETLHCDAGWRNYHFVKLTAEDGVVAAGLIQGRYSPAG